MDWNKYFKEKDEFKRYDMLEKDNRLSYDHIDNWLFSLKFFLSKTQANPEDLSANNDFKAQSVSPKVCPRCKLLDNFLADKKLMVEFIQSLDNEDKPS